MAEPAQPSPQVERRPSVSAIVGFLCPLCPGIVKLDSQELLAQHWEALHKDDVQPRDNAVADDLVERAKQQGTLREHAFEEQTWAKPRSCNLCSNLAWRSGLLCTVCKFCCHKKCLPMITEDNPEFLCVGTERYKQRTNALVKSIRKAVTGRKARFVTDFVDIDLTYITPRLIAMSFPASGLESTYRNDLRDVAAFLQTRHKDHYMVYNVSEKYYDATKFNNQVLDFGWPDHLAPTLERLCSVCKSVDGWLKADERNVAVVHCKGGKGRTGVVIAAYMTYIRLFTNPDDAMQQFAIKRFTDNDTPADDTGITQPSQKRFVRYFANVLSGKLNLVDRPLSFQHIVISGGIPEYSSKGGVNIFVRIYHNLVDEIYCSEPLTHMPTNKMDEDHIIIPLGTALGLLVAGDVLVRCFHRTSAGRDVPIFRVQFHTCAIKGHTLTLLKHELDDAHRDRRFPATAKTSFVFREPDQLPATPTAKQQEQALANQALLAGFGLPATGHDEESDGSVPQSPAPDMLSHPSNPFSPLYNQAVAGHTGAAQPDPANVFSASAFSANAFSANVFSAANDAQQPQYIPVDCEFANWFFGKMSGQAAERLLLEKADAGSFLMRTNGPSGKATELYLCVHCGTDVKTFPIQWDRESGYSLNDSGHHRSTMDLLQHFKRVPICAVHGVPVLLGRGFGMGNLESGSGARQRTSMKLKPIERKPSDDVRMARSLSTSSTGSMPDSSSTGAAQPESAAARSKARRLSFVDTHSED